MPAQVQKTKPKTSKKVPKPKMKGGADPAAVKDDLCWALTHLKESLDETIMPTSKSKKLADTDRIAGEFDRVLDVISSYYDPTHIISKLVSNRRVLAGDADSRAVMDTLAKITASPIKPMKMSGKSQDQLLMDVIAYRLSYLPAFITFAVKEFKNLAQIQPDPDLRYDAVCNKWKYDDFSGDKNIKHAVMSLALS